RQNEPGLYRRIRHYLLLSGFLTHRLTGRFIDSLAAQVGYLPFDYRRLAWAKPGDWSWRAAPIDRDWLPELVAPGGRLGDLTPDAAAIVGLPAGTPVIAAEALFDDLVRATEPGAMGLLIQPTWSPGVRIPGPEAKGAMIGFGDVHTRAHLYRAILEGLAYALRDGGERAAARARVPLRELRVSGGGAQSPAAVQLTADIFGLPTGVPHTHETSGLGAAIDAAVGLGLHASFESAIADMTRLAETIDPDPARHRLYDQLYQRVYRRMYGRLKPLYEEIMKITGYPPG